MLYQDKATRVFANILTRCYQIRAKSDQIFLQTWKNDFPTYTSLFLRD